METGTIELRTRPYHLIVVEDDPVTRTMIASYFTKEGFVVSEAETAADCQALLSAKPADILFIDIGLPDGNGISLAQEIRAVSAAGIILVTQRNSEIDRVVGLEAAADDYVTKPVNLRELLARTRALLRRRRLDAATATQTPAIVGFGDWRLNLSLREVRTKDGAAVPLTRGEFDLLAAIVQAGGRPVGRDYLSSVVSNRDEAVRSRTVDALVVRLRRKLTMPDADVPILVTVSGIGYRLGVAIES